MKSEIKTEIVIAKENVTEKRRRKKTTEKLEEEVGLPGIEEMEREVGNVIEGTYGDVVSRLNKEESRKNSNFPLKNRVLKNKSKNSKFYRNNWLF